MSATAVEVSDDDKRRHREAEKSLKEVGVIHPGILQCIYACLLSKHLFIHLETQAKQKLAAQVKVRW